MKSINTIKITLFTFLLVAFCNTSCDDGFQDLNTSPNTADNVDPMFLLTWIWTQPSGNRFTEWRSNLIIGSCWSQQMVSGFQYDTYNTTNEQYTVALIARMTDVMPEAQDIIDKNPNTIVGAMALTFKVHFMLRMADMHGEIPYSEAFKPGEFLQPQYEPLTDVFRFFVDDLNTAKEWLRNGLGENPGSFDPLYSGDIDQWFKFINSMMLRIGLRMTEVDMQRATDVVNAALNGEGGVMTSNDDIAWIRHSAKESVEVNASGIGGAFVDEGIGGHLFRFSDVFVDFMKNNNDPRMRSLMATYDDVGREGVLNTDEPSDQIGMRAGAYGVGDFVEVFDFAQPRREIVTRAQPAFLMTYAEVEFNRAEAFHRGMASGDAKVSYENGIRAATKMLTIFPDTEEVTDDAIDTYLQEPGIAYESNDPMVSINTQKWVALLFNGYEAWANQRRTDIPALVPVDVETRGIESDGTLPKRVRYPVSQVASSPDEIEKVIARQGPDNINTRLWWDVN